MLSLGGPTFKKILQIRQSSKIVWKYRIILKGFTVYVYVQSFIPLLMQTKLYVHLLCSKIPKSDIIRLWTNLTKLNITITSLVFESFIIYYKTITIVYSWE